ncbi:UDP-glucose dehydrogenase family protein [Alicyclobacillus herbarius]|uniref:UDP-glucose dehydrogenase family protein n=1 Tax=Alicyclobacillus herbarius TaxID=122960 RepID=UPI0003F56498|nr:UDP-glucose/GDP-mannose dehydrogenase family protein [Alicyclobacillus herbarius]
MKVIVIGAGYVGLVTAVCLAELGHQVTVHDTDADKISRLQAGRTPFYEPGLEQALQTQVNLGRLEFVGTVRADCDWQVALVAVGTPADADGGADLRAVFAAAATLARTLPLGAVVALKSTVPVGTANRIGRWLAIHGREDLRVASVPEFLREGSALADARQPNRLVIGVEDEGALTVLRELYAGVDAPVVYCDCASAEMTKYASNAFLATKISFINEIANICERTGADVRRVAEGMGLDPRIGPDFLRAGLGYGGSCFPKDTQALVRIAGDVDYDFQLLKAVVRRNQEQRTEPVRQLTEWLGDLSGRQVVLLGVAFKPHTDDVRESPALDLVAWLWQRGARMRLVDPVVRRVLLPELGVVKVMSDAYTALSGADAAVLVTEWPEFVQLDWLRVRQAMRQPFLFDGRNVLNPQQMLAMGFTFRNFGCRTLRLAGQLK